MIDDLFAAANGTRAVCAIALASALAAAVPPALASDTPPHGSLDRNGAAQAFAEGRYAVAYGRYAQLADAGDAAAALMALALVCEGESAFGARWSATPGQLQRWSALVGRRVSEHGARIAADDGAE